MIIAEYTQRRIPVRVTPFPWDKRKVHISALQGKEPFKSWSHGGPMTVGSKVVYKDFLHNIRSTRIIREKK